VYLFFLVATFPASKAYSIISRQLGKNGSHFVLYDVQGAWWSGQASAASFGTVQFGKISWRFRPLSLFLGQISASIKCEVDDGFIRGNISKGFNTLTLKKVDLRLPLDLLDSFSGQFGVAIGGYFSSNIRRIKIDKGNLVAADGTLVWNGAGMSSPQQLSLGDYKANFVTEKDAVHFTFADSGGPLKAEGVLKVNPDGNYTFSGTFVAVDKEQPTITDMLSLLGKIDDNGRLTVSYSGKMPRLPS
jgi:hypothetical protein